MCIFYETNLPEATSKERAQSTIAPVNDPKFLQPLSHTSLLVSTHSHTFQGLVDLINGSSARQERQKTTADPHRILYKALQIQLIRNLNQIQIAATMGDAQLFGDTFTITSINSQKYDRVSRLAANTENGDTYLTLDINTELFPCSVGERVHIMLASTLSLDGSKDDGKGWRDVGRGEQSLADDYEYVCHGKIYRFEEGDDENMWVW